MLLSVIRRAWISSESPVDQHDGCPDLSLLPTFADPQSLLAKAEQFLANPVDDSCWECCYTSSLAVLCGSSKHRPH